MQAKKGKPKKYKAAKDGPYDEAFESAFSHFMEGYVNYEHVQEAIFQIARESFKCGYYYRVLDSTKAIIQSSFDSPPCE